MYLIAGLGNPGSEYQETRHNVGFKAARMLAEKEEFPMEREKFSALITKGSIKDEDVIIVRPLTYMNNSGLAIRQVMDFYKIPVENVIIMYDDIDLPLGNLRIRENGSAGTHNGMRSIVSHLNSTNFPRIRIGVGGKPEGWDLADYVLSRFSGDEKEIIEETEMKAAKAAASIVKDGLSKAMNKFNSKHTGKKKKQKAQEETQTVAATETASAKKSQD